MHKMVEIRGSAAYTYFLISFISYIHSMCATDSWYGLWLGEAYGLWRSEAGGRETASVAEAVFGLGGEDIWMAVFIGENE